MRQPFYYRVQQLFPFNVRQFYCTVQQLLQSATIITKCYRTLWPVILSEGTYAQSPHRDVNTCVRRNTVFLSDNLPVILNSRVPRRLSIRSEDHISPTPRLLVIVVTDPDEVIKYVFFQQLNQLVAVLCHIPHVINSHHLPKLPLDHKRTKEIWKQTAIICGTDVLRELSTILETAILNTAIVRLSNNVSLHQKR